MWGRDKNYYTLKEKFCGFSQQDIMNFLKNTETYQIYTRPPTEKVHKPITSKRPLERLEIDICDLHNISGFNSQYRYLLTCVDHFTKYTWAIPMTKKNDRKVFEGLSGILEDLDRKNLLYAVGCIQSDNGGEFNNRRIKTLLDSNNIKQIFSSAYSPRSNDLVERFNGIIKGLIYKSLLEMRSKTYINVIDELMKNYNNSYHSTIKKTPQNALMSGDAKVLKQTRDNIIKSAEKMTVKDTQKFKRGQFVRVSLNTRSDHRREKLTKKWQGHYSTEVYKIVSVSRSAIHQYKLASLEGVKQSKVYYYDQLLPVDANNLIIPRQGETQVRSRALRNAQ